MSEHSTDHQRRVARCSDPAGAHAAAMIAVTRYELRLLVSLHELPAGDYAVIGTLDDDAVLMALHKRQPGLLQHRKFHGNVAWRLAQ